MAKIDRVLLSCDDNPLYIQFLPIVSMAWQKILGIKPTLAYVTDKNESEYEWIRKYCEDVLIFKVDWSLPNGRCRTFVPRLIMRYKFGSDICMVSDIDMVPLSNRFNNLLDRWESDKLISYGYNVFKHGDGDPKSPISDPDLRKFPSCYTIATSNIWKEIINPNNLDDDSLVKSWYNIKYYDYKEAVNTNDFDDESLVRAMVQRWNPKRDRVIGIDRDIVINKISRQFESMSDRLDRSKWNIDEEKLNNGIYIDAHCPRPMNDHIDSMKMLAKHIGIDFVEGENNVKN